jgi:hypothetical protein
VAELRAAMSLCIRLQPQCDNSLRQMVYRGSINYKFCILRLIDLLPPNDMLIVSFVDGFVCKLSCSAFCTDMNVVTPACRRSFHCSFVQTESVTLIPESYFHVTFDNIACLLKKIVV